MWAMALGDGKVWATLMSAQPFKTFNGQGVYVHPWNEPPVNAYGVGWGV